MSERLHVSVDFEAAGDPIAGTLTVGGAQRPFTGWLGLIAALEAAIAGRGSAQLAVDGISSAASMDGTTDRKL
jgi:hypothetical protein